MSPGHPLMTLEQQSNTSPPRHWLLRRRSLSRIRRNRHHFLVQPRPRRHRRLQTAVRLPISQIPSLRPRLQPSRRSNPRNQPRRPPQQDHFQRLRSSRPRRFHSRRRPRSRQNRRCGHHVHQAGRHGALLRANAPGQTPASAPSSWTGEQLHHHHRRSFRASDPGLERCRLVRHGLAWVDEAVGAGLEAFAGQSDQSGCC